MIKCLVLFRCIVWCNYYLYVCIPVISLCILYWYHLTFILFVWLNLVKNFYVLLLHCNAASMLVFVLSLLSKTVQNMLLFRRLFIDNSGNRNSFVAITLGLNLLLLYDYNRLMSEQLPELSYLIYTCKNWQLCVLFIFHNCISSQICISSHWPVCFFLLHIGTMYCSTRFMSCVVGSCQINICIILVLYSKFYVSAWKSISDHVCKL